MRKVTVSRMRDRYAQTVLTFRNLRTIDEFSTPIIFSSYSSSFALWVSLFSSLSVCYDKNMQSHSFLYFYLPFLDSGSGDKIF